MYYNFRNNGKAFLNRALSEDARQWRRQTVTVNIKITFLAWLLEFLNGLVGIAFWQIGRRSYFHLWRLWGQTLSFVLIPSAYILNREVTKQIIVLEDWFSGIKSVFLSRNDAEAIVEEDLKRINNI